MNNLLVEIFGWSAALIHGNTKTLDRWIFLTRNIPRVRRTDERVLEVGCGSGAFSMGLAKKGYEVVGLSWDKANQDIAQERARLSKIPNISFPICDARQLHAMGEKLGQFDIIVCCEVIEHIIDDAKLFKDMHRMLKPGGRLYLTTPNLFYKPASHDVGPWSTEEDGGHVRKGYTNAMIKELCEDAHFRIERIDYVSHFFSQLVSVIQLKLINLIGAKAQWVATLPLRLLPIFLDAWIGRLIGRFLGYPGYSITLIACKKRLS